MYVIGTAGHVDHGKSTLVHALTGIDPDRLQEEKQRGMTIDLGFAWLKLPSGREVSVVDVPGHERFIKNMLAGVGGIDLAILVVAADEGVMPQTREHLAIIDLLGIQRGLVALTKRDLVDAEWLGLVAADVTEAIAATALQGAPVLPCSATTGAGLPELVAAVDRMLEATPPRRDIGRPRLPIDRVFTISGFGTVVTGTLIDGSVRAGQEVEVAPKGIASRVRGLQTHRQRAEVAGPGSRVALNLAGLAVESLERGDVVTVPGWLRPTGAVDAELRLLAGAPGPLGHNASVTFHSLAAEAPAKVRVLDRPELEPGATGWVQLRLLRPLAVAKGDGFILRSSAGTIGGGTVVDAYPKRHKRFHPGTLAALATLGRGSLRSVLMQRLEQAGVAEPAGLLKSADAPADQARAALQALLAEGEAVALGARGTDAAGWVLAASAWTRVAETARTTLAEFHRQFPLRSGMSKEELRNRLKLPGRSAAEAVDHLLRLGLITEEGPTVRLPDHRVRLSEAEEAAAQQVLALLERDPYSPPEVEADAEVLAALAAQRRIVRVGDAIYFSAPVFDRMVERITGHLEAHQQITVAEVRDLFNTSRKYALALMEHLDDQRVTRRVGDVRVRR